MPAIEEQQLTALFINQRESLINFLQHRIQCQHTAQDLSQETFLRLLKQDNLEHHDNLNGYLFKIADRISIDFIRHQNRIQKNHTVIDDEIACSKIEPEQFAIIQQECYLLINAISKMTKRTRDVFLLRKIDELSYAEIACKLGVSEKTVQRCLVDAMLICHSALNLP